jgi:hypothetical protein
MRGDHPLAGRLAQFVVAALVALASLAAAAGASYELRVPDAVEAAPTVASTVSLTIAGTGTKTISKEGPIRIDLSSPTLTLPRTRYERRHAADPAAETPRFDLKFTAPTAGDHELVLALRFWVCGARTCRPVRASKTVTIHATVPAAPPDAGASP